MEFSTTYRICFLLIFALGLRVHPCTSLPPTLQVNPYLWIALSASLSLGAECIPSMNSLLGLALCFLNKHSLARLRITFAHCTRESHHPLLVFLCLSLFPPWRPLSRDVNCDISCLIHRSFTIWQHKPHRLHHYLLSPASLSWACSSKALVWFIPPHSFCLIFLHLFALGFFRSSPSSPLISSGTRKIY